MEMLHFGHNFFAWFSEVSSVTLYPLIFESSFGVVLFVSSIVQIHLMIFKVQNSLQPINNFSLAKL